jgi:hypothetical protein
MATIIIRNPSGSTANNFNFIFKPPSSVAGKRCTIQLKSFFISDLYKSSDSTGTMCPTSVRIDLLGLPQINSYDTYLDNLSQTIAVVYNTSACFPEQPKIVTEIPSGPVNLTVQLYNMEFSSARTRLTNSAGSLLTYTYDTSGSSPRSCVLVLDVIPI